MKRKLCIEPLENRWVLDAALATEIATVEDLLSQLDSIDVAEDASQLASREALRDLLQKRLASLNSGDSPPKNDPVIPSAEVETHNEISVVLESRGNMSAIGDLFFIDLYLEDTFTDPGTGQFAANSRGPFQAKFDLQFDPQVVRPDSDGVVLHGKYSGKVDADSISDGVLRNVGGLTAATGLPEPSDFVDGQMLLASVPFTAVGDGDVVIAAAPTGDGESVLIVGNNIPVPASNINSSPVELFIGIPETNAPPIDLPNPTPPAEQPVFVTQRLRLPTPNIGKLGTSYLAREDFDLRSELKRSEQSSDDNEQEEPLAEVEHDLAQQADSDEDENTGQRSDRDQSIIDSELSADDVASFWRNFDLSLFDDIANDSLFKLHVRSFRLRLSKTESIDRVLDAKHESNWYRAQKPTEVLDLGYVDIAPWLQDVRFRPERKDLPHQKLADEATKDVDRSIKSWWPQGKMATLQRLDTADDVQANESISERTADNVTDANTDVPTADTNANDE